MKRFPFPLRYSIPITLILCGSLLGIFSYSQEVKQIYKDTENKARNNLKISAGQTAIILNYLYRRKTIENAIEPIISQLGSDPNLNVVMLLNENNIVQFSSSYNLLNFEAKDTIAQEYLSFFPDVKNKRQGIILKSKKEENLVALYPVLLEALPDEIQPSRMGILLFEYSLTNDRQQAYRDALQRNLFSNGLLALFCLSLWFFFEFSLNRRVSKLVMASDRFAEGKLNTRTRLLGSDELAKISFAFDRMADKIEEHTTTLKEELLHKKIITDKLQETNYKLTLATEAKSEFLANMSHEIRTPMNGVIGITELLTLTNLDDEQKELVKLIQDSGTILLTIINDILSFSKSEAGKIQLEENSFDLSDLVKSICLLFAKQAEEKKIKIKYDIDSKIPDYIFGDPSRLRQIFLNLIANAIKFTHSGYIHISIEIKNNQQSEYELLVAIKDTGIGIDEPHLQKLFKPFNQADSSISRRYGGTGLGLAICKKLVELMGGQIWVESGGKTGGNCPENWLATSDSQGSIFYFTFKTKEVMVCDLKQKKYLEEDFSNHQNNQHGLKILLAEDNKVNQRVALLALKKMGYKADVANNGVEVLEMLSHQNYDVILMDMQMPEMDGLTTTTIIRETDNVQPYIIALTANILEQDRQKCFDAGMDDYMSKPLAIATLQKMLAELQKKTPPFPELS